MSLKEILLPFLLSCFVSINQINAQHGFGSNSTASCGTDSLMNAYFGKNQAAASLHRQIELQLKNFKKSNQQLARPLATVVLPVVVHIIHNNGTENISDARVLAGIQHLNEAFRNTGYYDPATGVNTNIQFCLVKRDPAEWLLTASQEMCLPTQT